MTDMIDMAQFVEAKSDQLNADDLIGAPRTITVRKVAGNDGEQPVSIFYEGDNNKPFKPCKTMRRVLLAVWGRNAADYVGRSMRIYRDDTVTFGGLQVGGIRISHMSHIDQETVVVVMKTKGKKAGIKVQPLTAEPTGISFTEARDMLATAATLDELKARWSSLEVKPHQKALKEALEGFKAELLREGCSDEQHDDQHHMTDDELAERAKAETNALADQHGVFED